MIGSDLMRVWMMSDLFGGRHSSSTWKIGSQVPKQGDHSLHSKRENVSVSPNIQRLQVRVNSHMEAIKFLLSQGFTYILSERFMQDVIADNFGHQRTVRGRYDNPSAQQFGYKDSTIAAIRALLPESVSGNTGGWIWEREMGSEMGSKICQTEN